MLELLSMFRPFSTWHFLLLVCLLDVPFILLHIAQPQLVAKEDGLEKQQSRRLREVLALQQEVSRSLEENDRALELLYRRRAELRFESEAFEEMERGISDLERQIERLKGDNLNTVT